jgi:hypothetical protein
MFTYGFNIRHLLGGVILQAAIIYGFVLFMTLVVEPLVGA